MLIVSILIIVAGFTSIMYNQYLDTKADNNRRTNHYMFVW